MCERCVKLIAVKILFYNFRKLLATCNCVYDVDDYVNLQFYKYNRRNGI